MFHGVDWVKRAQNMIQWRALANMINNIWATCSGKHLSVSSRIHSFSQLPCLRFIEHTQLHTELLVLRYMDWDTEYQAFLPLRDIIVALSVLMNESLEAV